MLKFKKALVVGGVATALAVPIGITAAQAATPGPGPAASTQQQAPGNGYGHMNRATGASQDCPYYDSALQQQWRDQRTERQQLSVAERQQLAQQHREQMQELRAGTAGS